MSTEKSYGGNQSFGMKEKGKIKESGQASEFKSENSYWTAEFKDELTEEDIKNYLKAGEIMKKVKEKAKKEIKKDMLLIDIADMIEGDIQKLGGECAFPVNLSVNEVAAHYTPSSNDEKKAEGLLSVDIGVSVNGCIADSAFSLDLTDNKEHAEMIKLNEKILDEQLKLLKPKVQVKEIGRKAQEILKNTSFSIIRNLSGHSLGIDLIHAGITIPNINNENTAELEGAIAIEPFLTKGQGEVYDAKPSEIYSLQGEGTARDRDARILLDFVNKNYKTRPFCKRWLEKAGLKKVSFCLSILVKQGILHHYFVLVEKSKMPVSQAEESALILHDKVVVYTR